ncbi:rhomboid family intramembrane serine protease [Spongiactinospora gelatinilytica]|uniref:Rhomboid family intramembrane serine protease n=1 Tax=Spongiactinospora gelatinilytica TaxID=2666298 RepID=A0A2W2G9R9_9ACTN|nr:rhomboid family intramembrane serine protease [Spongiactinospora gelatinilytica]PZG23564.1 rhomboid family intramembrane serine protease [Spongiactinospora gelatinilytica]
MNDFPTGYGSSHSPGGEQFKRGLREFLTGALGSALLLALLVGAMWLIEVIDYTTGGGLDAYGIVGWNPDSLSGILFAPFLHGGFGHLMANSVPLLILGFVAAIRGIGKFLLASLIIVMVSGVGVWLTTPPYYVTIGASGLVFGYFGYVVARGLFDRRILDIVLGVAVAVAYYSLLWGVLPSQEGISWQGHLFGLIGGVLAAWLLRRKGALAGA